MQMASSNFFLPLTGKEDTQRLEVKYKAFLESDEEEEEDEGDSQKKTGKGKVSQWTIDDKPSTSQWLHSPSKSDSINKQILHKKHLEKDTHARGNLQSPKQNVVKSSNVSNVSQKKEKKFNQPGIVGKKQEQKRISEDDQYIIDDQTDDSDNDQGTATEFRSQNENKKKNDVENGPNKSIFSTMHRSDGFSVEDTERPKLSVRPVAAKIDFQLSPDGEEPVVKVPACLNQYLRDYQRDGIKFLYLHYVQGKGAILGDDMGLGKTVQVIGFLSALLGKQGNHKDTVRALPKFIKELSDEISDSPPRKATKPFLIVGPACVMINWLEEFKTWGYFTTGKFHGTEKELCFKDMIKSKLEVVVTTFETFRDNVDRLCEIEWEGIIVDEVHKMKEPKAQISIALNQITTLCRYGLTGTALQNHMVDLWSILDWAQPGILGSLEYFNNKFRYAIEMGQRHDANKRDLALARKQKDKFAEIRKRIMLRRTKALIADQLPSKEDNVVMCRLTDFQVSVYKAILKHPHTALILQAEDPCDCGRKKLKASCCYKYTEDNKVKVWSLVLSFMHLLLKAANHCALLIPDKSGKSSQWQAKLAQEVSGEALKDFPQFVQQTRDAAFLTLSDPKYCGKMKILQGLLSVFSSSHDKVLVFSYSTRLLDIVEQYVIGQCYEYKRIDGKTSSQKRMEIVHQFNRDADIFICLISTKAGGLGLNLTGANRVVIFDPNWNPSHDLQAQDRAYRIGQTRNVKVYRLVSAGTIEENIYLRQIYKQQLDEVAVATSNAKRYFHGIQGDKASRGELFGVKNMFSLRTSDTCLTMDILKRNERLEKDLSGYDITRYIPPSVEVDNDDNSGEDGDRSIDENREESKEEREEDDDNDDDVLLQALFGKDRIFSKDKKKSSTRANAKNLSSHGLPENEKENDSSNNENEEEEEGDFFLPKIHKSSDHKSQKTNSEKQQSENGLFTVNEITFPGSTCLTIKTQKKPASPLKGKCRLKDWKPSPGLSWLFSSGDDDDEDNEKIDYKKSKDKEGESSKGNNVEQRVQGKTASMLSRLFLDSDNDCDDDDDDDEDDESVSESGNRQTCLETKEITKNEKKQQSKTSNQSKRKAKENQPSTSGVGLKRSKVNESRQSKTGTSKSSIDSVKAVFEECGVLHIHGNRNIIGSSRAEDHMTRCAMQEVFEMKTNTQMPALQCDPLPQESEEPKSKMKKCKKDHPDHNTPSRTKVGSTIFLVGQTPPGVQRQAWTDMCKFIGGDQINVAQRIMTCTPGERLQMLRDFYTHKHPKLGDTLDTLLRIQSQDETNTTMKGQHPREAINPSDLGKGKSEPSSSNSGRVKNISTNAKTPRPESSRPKRSKRQPLPATLTGQTLLDSESQESLTAHSPPTDPDSSLSHDEDERLSLVPPKHKSRSRNLTPTTSKSTTTTRLRQKALNKATRVKLFKKPSDRKGVVYNNNGGQEGDELMSVSGVDSTDKLAACVTQTVEDIPSLLCEMGGKTSLHLQQRKNSKNAPRVSSNKYPTTSNDVSNSDTQAYNNVSYSATSGQAKVTNKSVKKQSNTRRDYASILDDIFDDKTADINDIESPEENTSNQMNFKTAELSTERFQSHSESSKSNSSRVQDRPSTAGCNTQLPRNSSVCEVEESVEILDDSDDYPEVDAMFQNSTLKEESPSKRRKTSPGKGKRGRKGLSPKKYYEMEIVEDAGGKSESLFS